MNKFKRICTIAAGILFLFSMAGCEMVQKTPEAEKATVVAKFNGGTVTKGEVDAAMKDYIASMKKQYGNDVEKNSQFSDQIAQQKSTILSKLIDLKIEAIKAKELKPESDSTAKKDAQDQIDKMKEQYSDSFKSAIAQQGYTESTLYTEFVLYEFIGKDISATDKEAQTYYDSNKESYREKPSTTHLLHIRVATEAEAKKAKTRVTGGESFEAVAKDVSTDTETKAKGGDLGEVANYDQNYDSDFMTAAMELKDGEISDPVKTSLGYEIIKCVKKTDYPYKKFEDVKADCIDKATSDKKSKKWSDTIKKWEDAAKIKKYESKL